MGRIIRKTVVPRGPAGTGGNGSAPSVLLGWLATETPNGTIKAFTPVSEAGGVTYSVLRPLLNGVRMNRSEFTVKTTSGNVTDVIFSVAPVAGDEVSFDGKYTDGAAAPALLVATYRAAQNTLQYTYTGGQPTSGYEILAGGSMSSGPTFRASTDTISSPAGLSAGVTTGIFIIRNGATELARCTIDQA